ncbi:MAG: T9SS type A sorting domain-containing protein [Bacteroidetes bacterium]|nr:MAG: T9SS type A sorting domain-containing protein [Bacteroidota bacterium]
MKRKITLSVLFSFIALLAYDKGFSQIDLRQGLAAYYPFNGDVKDYSGNGNDGVIIGTPSLTTDRWNNANKCYTFNGNGDYVRVESDPTIEPVDAVSVSAWVNATDFSSWNIIVCKRLKHNSSPGNSYLLYGAGSPGQNQYWGFGVANTSSEQFSIDPAVIQTNDWVHVVGTYDRNASDSNVRVYVDGNLVKFEKATFPLAYSDSALRIGMAIPGPSKQYFKGKIDEVRIYNRALNQQEITALYNNTHTSIKNVEAANNKVEVFPNPANDKLFVSGEYKYETTKVIIFDLTGRKVLESSLDNTGVINIDALPAGLYVTQVLDSVSEEILLSQRISVQ